MEHELSAIYDITHGLGLAILTPRWMEYALNETTVSKFYQFGVNVFGIDSALPQMEVAKKSIGLLSEFLFKTLGLKSTLTEIGIDDKDFAFMAKKAVAGGTMYAFQPLAAEEIEKIYRMCL
jgi:alcohol dehydrogenase YqhD (iron-dependent ADH family)